MLGNQCETDLAELWSIIQLPGIQSV
jgi:hypothetical protein